MKLNPEQEKIVQHTGGPLLVIAGAGTGKTRVITERIKHLIEDKLAKPEEILALTFTQKAAEEMLLRLGDAMPLGYTEPWISTFHRFADRLLQIEGLEIGLDPSYKIISYPEQYLLIRENLFDFDLQYFRPLGNPAKFIGAMLKFFSRLQDECVTHEDFEDWIKTAPAKQEGSGLDRYRELASAYTKYQALKLEHSKMDFGDLILWATKLFADRPNILEKYQKQFKYVLIDEFQDTNYAQFELIKLLCPSKGRVKIIVVGDDDQAIYRFRGAALSNILDFRKTYPNCETVVLTKNYRSTQEILDSAYKLIQNNNPDRLEIKEKVDKKLISQIRSPEPRQERGSGLQATEPQVVAHPTAESESDSIVNKILELINRPSSTTYHPPSFKDFAILARSNSQLTPFVAALRRNGIPYQLLGNRGLFDQDEVKNLLAMLRWLAEPDNSSALFQILSGPMFNVESGLLQRLLQQSRRRRESLWKSLSFGLKDSIPIDKTVKQLQKFRKDAERKPVSRLLYEIILETDYIKPLIKTESIEKQLRLKNINLFIDKIKQY
jgi:DNA helicase-2/ATP-dependent DNA helicase PcrA